MKRILLVLLLVGWLVPSVTGAQGKLTCNIMEIEQQVTPDNVDKLINACEEKHKKGEKQVAMQVMTKLPMHFLNYGKDYPRPDQVIRYLKLQIEWRIHLTEKEQQCRLVNLINPDKSLQCKFASPLIDSPNQKPDHILSNILNNQESILKRLESVTQLLSSPQKLNADTRSLSLGGWIILVVIILLFLVIIWWIVVSPPPFIRRVINERRSKPKQRIEAEKTAPELLQEFSPIKIQVELSNMDVHVKQPQKDASMAALIKKLDQVQSSIQELKVAQRREGDFNRHLEQSRDNTYLTQTGQKPEILTDKNALLNELLATTTIAQAEEVAKRYGFRINSGELDRSGSNKDHFTLRSDNGLSPNTHLFSIILGDEKDDTYLVPLALKGQILTAPANWFYTLQSGTNFISYVKIPARIKWVGQDRRWFSLSSVGAME